MNKYGYPNKSFLLIVTSQLMILVSCNATPAILNQVAIEVSPTNTSIHVTLSPMKSNPASVVTPSLEPIIIIPTLSATALLSTSTPLACASQPGEVTEHHLDSELLRYPMGYMVYLPPCYHIQSDMNYPVLYLLHGLSTTHKQWTRMGIHTTADKLIQSGKIPPFIIVMPQDFESGSPLDDPFDEVLISELIPKIDAEYRTFPDRIYRSLGGVSRGGAWAIHIGLQNWQLFSKIGMHSPAIFWADEFEIPSYLDTVISNYPIFKDEVNIYLDLGDEEEIFESIYWFTDQLDSFGMPYILQVFPGIHEEEYWRDHADQYLIYYTSNW